MRKLKRWLNSFNEKVRKSINIYSICAILSISIFLLTVAYAALGKKLTVTGMVGYVDELQDIRVTNVVTSSSSTGGISTDIHYTSRLLNLGITLPTATSTVVFDITVENFGNVAMGINAFKGLPDNLKYSVSDYTLGTKICDTAGNCKLGAKKTFKLTIQYKDASSFSSSNVSFPLSLTVDFRKFHTIKFGPWIGLDDVEVADGGSYNTTKLPNMPYYVVTMGNKLLTPGTDYTNNYYPGTVTQISIDNITDDVEINRLCVPAAKKDLVKSFKVNSVYQYDAYGTLPDGKIQLGDEYVCTVDGFNKYNFRVASISDDTVSLNLIAGVNSNGSLTKGESVGESVKYGANLSTTVPDNVFTIIDKITQGWPTFPRIKINRKLDKTMFTVSTSDTGDIRIGMTNSAILTYKNMRARIPYYEDVEEICEKEEWITGNVSQYDIVCPNSFGYPGWILPGIPDYEDKYYYGVKSIENSLPDPTGGAGKDYLMNYVNSVSNTDTNFVRLMVELPKAVLQASGKLGDVNNDTVIDEQDVEDLSEYVEFIKQNPSQSSSDAYELNIKTEYADVYDDGVIDSNDVDTLLSYVDGEIESIPVQPAAPKTYICQAVTQETASKTSSGALKGFVPFKGNVAPMGEEFICKVNDTKSYHFFVVSKSKITDDADIDLILEDNISKNGSLGGASTAFAASGAIKDGPIKAYDDLYSATKDWTNIPSQKFSINYLNSKGGFSYSYSMPAVQMGLKTNILNEDTGTVTASYLELKARLPFTAYDVISGEYARGTYWVLDTTPPSTLVSYHDGLSITSGLPYFVTAGVGVRPVITVKGSDIGYN